jgi:hypothetical protein
LASDHPRCCSVADAANTPSSRGRRWRSVRRQRGAALLEGLIVGAACLALLGLGAVVHEREAARLERERERRAGVWLAALEGCAEPGRVTDLAHAALQGGAATAAERLAQRVLVLGAGSDPRGRALAPCNESVAIDADERSRVATDLEHQLLRSSP